MHACIFFKIGLASRQQQCSSYNKWISSIQHHLSLTIENLKITTNYQTNEARGAVYEF